MVFRVVPQTIAEWLHYINEDTTILNRLSPYENDLANLLEGSLQREQDFRSAFELLMLVFPYFALTLAHIDRWSLLLFDALLMAQEIRDNELQMKLFRWLGESFIKAGDPRTAREVFKKGLERAEEGEVYDLMVAIYTGTFKLQWFDLQQNVTGLLVKQALDAARYVNHASLKADMYDALGLAYGRIGDTQTALGYAQTAFAYWHAARDHAGLGRTAYTLSAIFTHLSQLTEENRFLGFSRSYLEIARYELAQTNAVWQYSLLAYEQARIHYQLGDYAAAASWFKQALDEAGMTTSPHYRVVAQHGLGLAQVKLGQFPDARRSLLAALRAWDDLNNVYEKGSILVGLADLEYQAGYKEKARNYLYSGLEIARDIKDEAMQRFLVEQFNELERKLAT